MDILRGNDVKSCIVNSGILFTDLLDDGEILIFENFMCVKL